MLGRLLRWLRLRRQVPMLAISAVRLVEVAEAVVVVSSGLVRSSVGTLGLVEVAEAVVVVLSGLVRLSVGTLGLVEVAEAVVVASIRWKLSTESLRLIKVAEVAEAVVCILAILCTRRS